jgi:sugar lactone lactonase YvrE
MSRHYSAYKGADPSGAPNTPLHAAKRPAFRTHTRTGALCALVFVTGFMLLPQAEASATGMDPLAPGSVVVSQGGTMWATSAGTGVELYGEVDVYPPSATGNVAPQGSFTNGSFGPVTMIFDSSGDLWVANEFTSDLFEFTKAQLATPNPVPAVTIFAYGGAFASPFGLAFDQAGNLWVASAGLSKIYEYTKDQLARSGAPTPHTTISALSGTPIFGVAFDASDDLWVSTVKSMVEFSKAELAKTNPVPTVTISSSGGAELVFDPSGDLWAVTGGGPSCYGTPCTNEVVEFAKSELSTSGSPAPAVTISSTKPGPAGSLYGPYSLALTSSGDLWVENFYNNTTVEYGKDQLSSSGSPTPVRTISGPETGMNYPTYVVVAP